MWYVVKNSDGTQSGTYPTRADAYVSIVLRHRENGRNGECTMQHVEDDTHSVNYFDADGTCEDDAVCYIEPVK